MTTANQLTLLRIPLAAAVFLALLCRTPVIHPAALGLFLAALATDALDGWLARKTGTVSDFGKIVDPVADQILILGALIALLKHRELGVPFWGVFLTLARELLMGGLRAVTATKGGIIGAQRWGKWKMAIQSAAVALMMVILILSEHLALPAWLMALPWHLTVLCALAAWISAALYYAQARGLLKSSWS